jgi:hypothetical protein
MITFDLSFFYIVAGSIMTALAGMWAFQRARRLLG